VAWEAAETGWLEQNWNSGRRIGNVRRCADLTRAARFRPVLKVCGIRPLRSARRKLLRSNNIETAMWADSVIKQHILPEPTKHLPFPYMKRPYD
jgi:hypothetical protein